MRAACLRSGAGLVRRACPGCGLPPRGDSGGMGIRCVLLLTRGRGGANEDGAGLRDSSQPRNNSDAEASNPALSGLAAGVSSHRRALAGRARPGNGGSRLRSAGAVSARPSPPAAGDSPVRPHGHGGGGSRGVSAACHAMRWAMLRRFARSTSCVGWGRFPRRLASMFMRAVVRGASRCRVTSVPTGWR